MSKDIALKPRLTEKTHGLHHSGVYVVVVDKTVNKHSVARAVEAQFDVEVKNVNIVNVSGKKKRTRNLNGTRYANSYGHKSDIKKAYVTLKDGHKLPFFESIEESDEQEKKLQEQLDKQKAKEDKKESKKDSKKDNNKEDKPAKILKRGKKEETK